jgi:hypothetical protein
MKRGAVRKLMRAAILSLLAFGMTSGVVGMEVWAANSAMAQPGDQSGGSDGGDSGSQGGGSAPGSGSPENPVTKVVGGVVGGSGA